MRNLARRVGLAAAVIGLMAGAVGEARASLILVINRSSLDGNDDVDWGALGSAPDQISNPFTITSSGGVSLNVSEASGGSFMRRDNGSGWNGNFAAGDHLLWTHGSNGPMTIDFGLTGVSAVGTQLQSHNSGTFTATITAYDAANNLLGSFTETGNSAFGSADNSAIFLGIRSTTNDIARITYSVSGGNDFAINQLDFDTRTPPVAVPEPSTLMLGSVAGLASLGTAWRRRKRARG